MKKSNWILAGLAGAGVAALAYKLLSKSDIPDEALLKNFDQSKYMGKWYEIARLPSIIEKNLDEVIEDYSPNPDGSFKVTTSVHNAKKDNWRDFSGTIKPADDSGSGRLKVSYFEPIYFAYNVLDITDDYQHTLVSTSNLNYLWLMSREKSMPQHVKDRFLLAAEGIGFDTSKLEWLY